MQCALVLLGLLVLLAVQGTESRLTSSEIAYWNDHSLGVLQTGQQAGNEVKFGQGKSALDAYVVTPPGKSAPQEGVIIFTDIYGWELPNTRLWADRLAKEGGFLVVIPDFFRGDPVTEAIRPNISEWRLRHPREEVLADFASLLPALKQAYPSVTKWGQQGFCWGGLYSVLLSGPQNVRVDAAVAFHPSGIDASDIEAITRPIMIQAADPKLDKNLNPEVYQKVQEFFATKRSKGVDAVITSYPGMPHGFALRGNLTDKAWAKASNTAFTQGMQFLQARLVDPCIKIKKDQANYDKCSTSAQLARSAVTAAKARGDKEAAPVLNIAESASAKVLTSLDP